jgi:hypothetical protein
MKGPKPYLKESTLRRVREALRRQVSEGMEGLVIAKGPRARALTDRMLSGGLMSAKLIQHNDASGKLLFVLDIDKLDNEVIVLG